MPLIAAKCPNCGADIKLDDTRETGICTYCDSTIILKEAMQTVQIDNSHMIQNWMTMGLSAYKIGNKQEAYNYFTKVVENDINNWEAIFYKSMSAGWQSTMANPRIMETMKGIQTAQEILLVRTDISQEEKDLHISLFAVELYQIVKAYFKSWTDYYFNTVDHYNSEKSIKIVHRSKECLSYMDFVFFLVENNSTIEDIKHEMRKFMSELCFWICDFYSYWLDYSESKLLYYGLSVKDKQKYLDIFDKLMIDIKKIQPDYSDSDNIKRDEPPTNSMFKTSNVTAKTGCYIATAVYGSYNAPEVLILRNFRDKVLMQSMCGRMFVKLYYFFSPSIANKLKYDNRINKIVKNILNQIIIIIKSKGA